MLLYKHTLRVERMNEMSRPQTKQDLIDAATSTYNTLLKFIDSMTEEELNTPFDFSNQPSKKEAHWKRDKNVRDVLVHLHEWHQLSLNWIANNKKGIKKPLLMEGYNWKSYGDMNMVFWKNCQNMSQEEAMELFKTSHQQIMEIINSMSNEQLFARDAYDWTGGNCIGAYLTSNTSSHYDWAMKKLKAHRKNVSGK